MCPVINNNHKVIWAIAYVSHTYPDGMLLINNNHRGISAIAEIATLLHFKRLCHVPQTHCSKLHKSHPKNLVQYQCVCVILTYKSSKRIQKTAENRRKSSHYFFKKTSSTSKTLFFSSNQTTLHSRSYMYVLDLAPYWSF